MKNFNILNINPDRVRFVVWSFDDDSTEINIDGEELVYAQLGDFHHGLQCAFVGGHPNHEAILDKLKQVSELLKQVSELNKVK